MPASLRQILKKPECAAAQRGLAGPTLAAYRRAWRAAVIRAASEFLDTAALPETKAAAFSGSGEQRNRQPI